MAQAARRRTAAQRAKKDEDAEPVTIQDEQEQEKEVRELREKNEQDNKSAWRILDGFIAVGIIMKQIEAYQNFQARSSSAIALMLSLQGILTGFAFSPQTIDSLTTGRLAQSDLVRTARVYGTYALAAITAIASLLQHRQAGLGGAEVIRTAMPLILHAASWMQLNSEEDMVRKLETLEKSKYQMKGA